METGSAPILTVATPTSLGAQSATVATSSDRKELAAESLPAVEVEEGAAWTVGAAVDSEEGEAVTVAAAEVVTEAVAVEWTGAGDGEAPCVEGECLRPSRSKCLGGSLY